MSNSTPQTTLGLAAKARLRAAWFEAHLNQPVPEGRAEVERAIGAIEAEAVAAALREHDARLRAAVEAHLFDEDKDGDGAWGRRCSFCLRYRGEHESDCRVAAVLALLPEEARE